MKKEAIRYSSISMRLVETYLIGFASKGGNVQQILSAVGISPALREQPKARVPADQFRRLLLAVIQELHDESFGYLSHKIKPGTFAMMSHAVIHCIELKSAWKRLIQFYQLLSDEYSFSLIEEKSETYFRIQVSESLAEFGDIFTISSLVFVHRFMNWLIGQYIPLNRAILPQSLADQYRVNDYKTLFHCPLEFNQSQNQISFQTRFLYMPIIQTPHTLSSFLKDTSELFIRYQLEESFTAKTRRFLAKELPFKSVEHLAKDFHITPQTLRRRLRAEGNSYQKIKDELCRDHAIYYLTNQQLTIENIAHILGFSEASTFHRAFKKWTGRSPGSYRKLEYH